MKHGRLYAAPDVARFCGVDLTTVHAWVKRGAIAHERSPGGQLRFRRVCLVAFLVERNFPIPKAISREPGLVGVVGALPSSVVGALAQVADVWHEPSPVRALVELRERCPDVLVLGTTLGFSRVVLVREVATVDPHLVVACLASSPAEGLAFRDAGAKVVGLTGLDDTFVAALGQVLGREPVSPPKPRG